MKAIEMKEAKGSLAQYAKGLKRDPLILMAAGKPFAALISTQDLDWETISLSLNSKFINVIEHSRKSHKKFGGISTEEMRRLSQGRK